MLVIETSLWYTHHFQGLMIFSVPVNKLQYNKHLTTATLTERNGEAYSWTLISPRKIPFANLISAWVDFSYALLCPLVWRSTCATMLTETLSLANVQSNPPLCSLFVSTTSIADRNPHWAVLSVLNLRYSVSSMVKHPKDSHPGCNFGTNWIRCALLSRRRVSTLFILCAHPLPVQADEIYTAERSHYTLVLLFYIGTVFCPVSLFIIPESAFALNANHCVLPFFISVPSWHSYDQLMDGKIQ